MPLNAVTAFAEPVLVFADARPWWVVGLWLGVCALFVVLADRWLRHFERGPLETVMHRVQAAPREPIAAVTGQG